MHSEWSWDTSAGDMEQSCVRAVELGLPAVSFTEHLDHTVWRIALDGPYVMDNLSALADADGLLTPPAFDAAGYLAAIERCRERFPQLRILSGLEVGEHYPVRFWPAGNAGPFDPAVFEDEFRHALRLTAQPGRALEVNARLPLHATVLTWWHEEGGDAITFGSDAHVPALVGHGFAEAVQMAEAHGFRPGESPYGCWGRIG